MSVIIQKDINGEYRVPSLERTEAGAYYTDDRQDALETAKKIHGADVSLSIKRVKEFSEEKLFILSRHWPNPQPHGQTYYVANLPGEGNSK